VLTDVSVGARCATAGPAEAPYNKPVVLMHLMGAFTIETQEVT